MMLIKFNHLDLQERLDILNNAANAYVGSTDISELPTRYAITVAREALFLEQAGIETSIAQRLAERCMSEGARIAFVGAGLFNENDLRMATRRFDVDTLLPHPPQSPEA